MTPADHANTEARWELCKGQIRDAVTKRTIGAATILNHLDALQAQAEERIVPAEWLGLTQQLEAAEAERDRLAVLVETYERAHLVEARANEQLQADRNKLLRVADKRLTEGVRMRAERDRLADALQRIADGTWTPTTGDSVSPREFARAALTRRERTP